MKSPRSLAAMRGSMPAMSSSERLRMDSTFVLLLRSNVGVQVSGIFTEYLASSESPRSRRASSTMVAHCPVVVP